MKPVQILHLNTESGWRGGEAQTLLLARRLRDRGHGAIIAAPEGSELARRASEDGLEVWTCRMRGEFDPAAVLQLSRLLRQRHPGLLHYHSSHAVTLGTLAGLVAFPARRRPPVVLTRRVSFSLRRNPLARLKYSFRVDHVIAVADGVRWVLLAEGLSPRRVSVIHSGIDLSLFDVPRESAGRSFRKEIGVPEGCLLVGSVGALVPHKGHRFLLEAAGELFRNEPDAHLVLVGEGPLRSDFEEQARSATLAGRVHFTGFRRDIPAVMAALDVFVLPSVSGEGSPAVVKEAMASRVPLVATDLEGVREIAGEGDGALFVPPGDAARLREALEALTGDEKLRERLARRAREKVFDYSAERMVERTEEVYERVLSRRLDAA